MLYFLLFLRSLLLLTQYSCKDCFMGILGIEQNCNAVQIRLWCYSTSFLSSFPSFLPSTKYLVSLRFN